MHDPSTRQLLDQYRAAVQGHPVNNRGTTHISTIDSAGNSAALTLSNGEGSGHLLPDSGIMLNNMLGEEDLNPAGFNRWPCDVRVSFDDGADLAEAKGQLIAIGSGGSTACSAILQTLVNMIDFDMTGATGRRGAAHPLRTRPSGHRTRPGWTTRCGRCMPTSRTIGSGIPQPVLRRHPHRVLGRQAIQRCRRPAPRWCVRLQRRCRLKDFVGRGR